MERATALVKEFLDKLRDKGEQLEDFDMEKLRTDEYKKFGCGDKKRFEYDNSELVKALFVVLWHDEFEKKGIQLNGDTVGDGKAFRGDTIHTSGALFGQKIDGKDQYEGLSSRYNIQNEEMTEKIKKWPVSRIGNMLLLPSKSLGLPNKKGVISCLTINTFRGYHSHWHDYFDIFLSHLKNVYGKTQNQIRDKKEAILNQIMYLEENKPYFDCFNNFQGWVEAMLLNDYLYENGEIKKLLAIPYEKYPYHWRYRSSETIKKIQEDYREWVEKFIERTTDLINKRSKRMVEKLKSKGFLCR